MDVQLLILAKISQGPEYMQNISNKRYILYQKGFTGSQILPFVRENVCSLWMVLGSDRWMWRRLSRSEVPIDVTSKTVEFSKWSDSRGPPLLLVLLLLWLLLWLLLLFCRLLQFDLLPLFSDAGTWMAWSRKNTKAKLNLVKIGFRRIRANCMLCKDNKFDVR